MRFNVDGNHKGSAVDGYWNTFESSPVAVANSIMLTHHEETR